MNIIPTPPAEPTQPSGRHTLPRIFIGPLPKRVLSSAQQSVAKHVKRPRRLFGFNQSRQTPTENDEPVEELINHYAYAFHLKLGGSEGDWNEERENSVKDEMFQRWRESPWGRLWRGKKDSDSPNASHARWVLPNDAGSFQIGDFLGLDTYAEPAPTNPRLSNSSNEEGPSTSRRVHYGDPSTTTGNTFVTARSHISPEPETALPVPPSQSLSLLEDSPAPSGDRDMPIATSSASLIRVVPAADRPPIRGHLRTEPNHGVFKLKPALRSRALAPASVIDDTPHAFDRGKGKGKGKAKKVLVHVPHDPSPPAPPGEVLQRTGNDMEGTSAAAAEEFQAATTSSTSLDVPDEYDDARMRGESFFHYYLVRADTSSLCCSELGYGLRSDRMVVRVAYCKNDNFGPHFDEMQDRCVRHMQYEDWAEFMVIWRGHRLELYNNFVWVFSIPLQCLSSDECLLEIAW